MVFAAIDPHGESRERLAVQGVGRISNSYFTRHLFREWGISLCLIHRTTMELTEPIVVKSGSWPQKTEYWSSFFPLPLAEKDVQHHVDNVGEQKQPSCYPSDTPAPEKRRGHPGDQDEQRPIQSHDEGIDVNRGE